MAVMNRRFLDQWRAAGLAGPLADVLNAWLTENTRLHAAGAALAVAQRGAVRQRGRGADVEVPTGPDYRAAMRTEHEAALRRLKGYGDTLLVEHIRPAHDQLLADARELAAAIGDIRSDAAALKPTTATAGREAWVALGRLHGERDRLVRLVRSLVSDRVVPRWTVQEGDDGQWRWFAAPDRGPKMHNAFATGGRIMMTEYSSPPAARRMADLALDPHDRMPGIYTADEVKRHQREAEQRAIARARGEADPEPRRDALPPVSAREQRAAQAAQEYANDLADAAHADEMARRERIRNETRPRRKTGSGLRSGAAVPGV